MSFGTLLVVVGRPAPTGSLYGTKPVPDPQAPLGILRASPELGKDYLPLFIESAAYMDQLGEVFACKVSAGVREDVIQLVLDKRYSEALSRVRVFSTHMQKVGDVT